MLYPTMLILLICHISVSQRAWLSLSSVMPITSTTTITTPVNPPLPLPQSLTSRNKI